MWFDIPVGLAPFILGFAPGDPRLTIAAGVYIIGYYYALLALWLLVEVARQLMGVK